MSMLNVMIALVAIMLAVLVVRRLFFMPIASHDGQDDGDLYATHVTNGEHVSYCISCSHFYRRRPSIDDERPR